MNSNEVMKALRGIPSHRVVACLRIVAPTDRTTRHSLMANRRYEWWVIGYIGDPSAVDLTKWKPLYRDRSA